MNTALLVIATTSLVYLTLTQMMQMSYLRWILDQLREEGE